MKLMELSEGKQLVVGIVAESLEAFVAEMPGVTAALLAWKAKHKDLCESVLFTVISAPEHHPAIEALLKQGYDDEPQLSPVLRSLSVKVLLLDGQGQPVKEYVLRSVPSTAAGSGKPWWKFW